MAGITELPLLFVAGGPLPPPPPPEEAAIAPSDVPLGEVATTVPFSVPPVELATVPVTEPLDVATSVPISEPEALELAEAHVALMM